MTTENWPPKPGPEHERLKQNAGTWDVACSYFMGPDQPPMKVKATETIEMFGQFWTVSRFRSNMMGMPFEGEAVIGYDTSRGRWVGTWMDTLTPLFFFFEGNFDSEGKVLEMSGEGGDPQSGGMARYRTTETSDGPGRRVFEMFKITPDGDVKMFSYVYTRAKAAPKAAASNAHAKKGSAKTKTAARSSGKKKAAPAKGRAKAAASKRGRSARISRKAGGKK